MKKENKNNYNKNSVSIIEFLKKEASKLEGQGILWQVFSQIRYFNRTL